MIRNMKTLHILSLFVALSLLLTACQGLSLVKPTVTPVPTETPLPTATAIPSATFTPTVTATPTLVPTSTPIPIVYGPTDFPADVNPLTGLKVSDPTILNRRPVTVKVANFPREGRPHAGLSFADLVFEYYIGEGTNRFLALYYGQDAPKVGPVRSGRMVDAQLVRQFQGILAYVSADIKVLQVIWKNLDKRAISLSPYTCPGLCDDGKGTVTSVFAETASLTKFAAQQLGIAATKPNLDGFAFDTRLPATTQPAAGVAVQWNPADRGEWRYDAASGTYLRWIESVDANNAQTMVPLTDRVTEKQLGFTNVVIVFAKYTELAPTLHEIDMWYNNGGQRAVLFRDGVLIEGTWKSAAQDAPMQFFLPDGKPMTFKPGNTWFVLTGLNSTLKQPSAGQWEMNFALPLIR